MAKRTSAASAAMAAARANVLHIPEPQNSIAPTAAKSGLHREPTDAEIEAAITRSERLQKIKPRAAAVRYDRKTRMIVVTFTNGVVFGFPPALVNGFSRATAEQLADVTIGGAGYGLHWKALDVALTAAGLIKYVFGSRRAQGRAAGRVKSPAKAAAARANGVKGGRPRKPQ